MESRCSNTGPTPGGSGGAATPKPAPARRLSADPDRGAARVRRVALLRPRAAAQRGLRPPASAPAQGWGAAPRSSLLAGLHVPSAPRPPRLVFLFVQVQNGAWRPPPRQVRGVQRHPQAAPRGRAKLAQVGVPHALSFFPQLFLLQPSTYLATTGDRERDEIRRRGAWAQVSRVSSHSARLLPAGRRAGQKCPLVPPRCPDSFSNPQLLFLSCVIKEG